MPWDPFSALTGGQPAGPPPNRAQRRAMDKMFRQQARQSKKLRARQRTAPQDGQD